MKICGIVAEYNPFHNGHLYHLNEARRLSGADYTIVVMSGNFMQRGTPAMTDKYTRARAALSCGADLVVELPAFYATGSAEFFAAGAISLLDQLGAVTHLCFGSEYGNTNLLTKAAQIILEEPAVYKECLQKHLKKGATYPSARTAALLHTNPGFCAYADILHSPNNILGLEYIKAILKQKSTMVPLTVKRQGADYHDTLLKDSVSSATGIRKAIQDKTDILQLQAHMPPEAYAVLSDYLGQYEPVFSNDFSEILYYKLLSECDKGFTTYADVSRELSDRICNNIYGYTDFESFCDLLKTKEITHSRISRCLTHILLDIKKEDLTEYMQELSVTPYARVLGFQKKSAPLLGEIHKQTTIPLITKLADAHRQLDVPALSMLKKEITINTIYNSIRTSKSRKSMVNEYSTPIIIL